MVYPNSRPQVALLVANMKTFVILILAGVVFAIVIAIIATQCATPSPPVGKTASASLVSSEGEAMGNVNITQMGAGVLVAVEVEGLSPGGHALAIHEFGACTPNFDAAGDHFAPDYGLIHPAWQRGTDTPHEGDLPNIYASGDGHARADFLAAGITLSTDVPHSVFDTDGSSIIVYEKPSDYSHEEDYGDRLVCGVITPN